jgi:hypothetical protein
MSQGSFLFLAEEKKRKKKERRKGAFQRGPGTREKVRSKRINLEGNTHSQEINVSQCPV